MVYRNVAMESHKDLNLKRFVQFLRDNKMKLDEKQITYLKKRYCKTQDEMINFREFACEIGLRTY